MSVIFKCTDPEQKSEGIAVATQALGADECIVMPTDTVYGVAANAFSPKAVALLLASKGRNRSMPPPVLIGSKTLLETLADEVPESAKKLAEVFWPGALTMILRSHPSLHWDLGETAGTVALRNPDDQVALDVLSQSGPLAVSSANRSGQKPAHTIDEAKEQLQEAVSVYLDDGFRPHRQACSDSQENTTETNTKDSFEVSTIVDMTRNPPEIVRLGSISYEELQYVVSDIVNMENNSGQTPNSKDD